MRPLRIGARGLAGLAALTAGALALAAGGEHAPTGAADPAPVPEKPGQFQAEPPPFTPGIFPCKSCHEGPGDKTRRVLSFHEDIKFDHGSEHRWCLDCHTNENRDVLHLSDGTLVPFTESYLLCGQCHGDKYRDWRAGVHGKRTGQWDGQKTYYLCVNCHNPHSPAFKPMKPEPMPVRPEEMRR